MSPPKRTASLFSLLLFFIIFIFNAELFPTCHGDVGTASQYSAPYIPTECYSEDATEFPSNNLFAAAGDEIWNNGATCGMQYVVRCISAPAPAICADPDTTIQVKIVDYANTAVSRPPVTAGTTLLLCDTAFAMLLVNTTSLSTASFNIEYEEV